MKYILTCALVALAGCTDGARFGSTVVPAPGNVTVNLGDASLTVTGSSIVQVDSGSVNVTNDAANPVPVTGAITASGLIDASCAVSNFPASQTVAGTLTCNAGSGTFNVSIVDGGPIYTLLASGINVNIADAGPITANGSTFVTNDASQAVPVSLIDASLSATVSGTLNTIVQNDAGNAIPVSVGSGTVTINGVTWTRKSVATGAVQTWKASAGTLGLMCCGSTDTTEAVYMLTFDKATTPLNGDSPVWPGPIAKVTSGAGDQGWCTDVLATQGGAVAHTTGIGVGISTTLTTLTAADAGTYYCWGLYQ